MAGHPFRSSVFVAACAALVCVFFAGASFGDETCNSPYISKLIKGQEDYVYVWTLGVEGLGDGSDKLVTVDVNPKSKNYGKVIHSGLRRLPRRGAPHGLHRRPALIWAGGLAGSKIYVFDIAADPAKPKLVRTISDLAEKDRLPRAAHLLCAAGPHAGSGAFQRQGQGRRHRHGAVQQQGRLHHDLCRCRPTDGGDGYGYDLAVNPKKNVLLTSSFTGYTNYMRPLGELIKDDEAMKRFGNTMVVWDLKAMKPQKVFNVPGAPLEIRWSLNPATTGRSPRPR